MTTTISLEICHAPSSTIKIFVATVFNYLKISANDDIKLLLKPSSAGPADVATDQCSFVVNVQKQESSSAETFGFSDGLQCARFLCRTTGDHHLFASTPALEVKILIAKFIFFLVLA
jgi:hypothetical protein